MKKIVLLFVAISIAIVGCVGGSVGVRPVQPCIVDKPDGSMIEFNAYCQEIKDAGRISNICALGEKHNVDACYLHRGMEIISKEGLIMEGYTAEDFTKWGEYVKERVRQGITYGTLKDIVLAQFTKFNRLIGAQVLILGDMFLQLPQDVLIPMDDSIIVVSSINDLVNEVKALDIWI